MDNWLIASESDRQNLDTLLRLYKEHPRGFGSMLKSRKFADLSEWLDSKTPLLRGGGFSSVTKLYWVMNGLVDFPVCGFCGKMKLNRNVDDFERGYFRACSKDCPGMKSARLGKIGDACEKKYGCRNFFASDAGKKAREAWCAENGVENPFQLESVKEKSKRTRMERFGSEFTMQSEEKRELAS